MREQNYIASDSDKATTEFRVALDQRSIECENARRLARLVDACNGVFDRAQHLRMSRIAQVAHSGGEIGRTDENAVHTFYRRNRIKVLRER